MLTSRWYSVCYRAMAFVDNGKGMWILHRSTRGRGRACADHSLTVGFQVEHLRTASAEPKGLILGQRVEDTRDILYEFGPSLRSGFASSRSTCFSMVRGERDSRSAISRLALPSQRRTRISASRLVMPSARSAAGRLVSPSAAGHDGPSTAEQSAYRRGQLLLPSGLQRREILGCPLHRVAPAVGDGGCGGEPPRLESVPPYVDWLAQLRVGFGKGRRSRYRVAGTSQARQRRRSG
jgi:hypothetical protein